MGTVNTLKEGTIDVGGESITYCWNRENNRWRLCIRVQNGWVQIPSNYPQGNESDEKQTADIIKDWLECSDNPKKFAFISRLKGRKDRP